MVKRKRSVLIPLWYGRRIQQNLHLFVSLHLRDHVVQEFSCSLDVVELHTRFWLECEGLNIFLTGIR